MHSIPSPTDGPVSLASGSTSGHPSPTDGLISASSTPPVPRRVSSSNSAITAASESTHQGEDDRGHPDVTATDAQENGIGCGLDSHESDPAAELARMRSTARLQRACSESLASDLRDSQRKCLALEQENLSLKLQVQVQAGERQQVEAQLSECRGLLATEQQTSAQLHEVIEELEMQLSHMRQDVSFLDASAASTEGLCSGLMLELQVFVSMYVFEAVCVCGVCVCVHTYVCLYAGHVHA